MHYEISKATLVDLPAILQIYEDARAFMRSQGNPNQWGTNHPAEEILRQDIAVGDLYLCRGDGEVLGVFFYAQGDDPTYATIAGAWQNDEPYGVIHRIAVKSRSRGVASFCFDWALKRCPNLRIDTHRDNIAMQKALAKNGFQYCGVIRIASGDERIAFQKTT